MASRRYMPVLLSACTAVFIFCLLRFQYYDEVLKRVPWGISTTFSAGPLANSTLGFGAIIANSAENQDDPKSWRRRGLIAAANRTGLDIRIPPQAPVNQSAIDLLIAVGNGPHPKPGSARAYYAYLGLLEQFLASDMETVLLVEDDVDWELDIRKMVAPWAGIPSGIRDITGAKDDPEAYPYGREWDMLWLGHCGFQPRGGDQTLLVKEQDTIPNARVRSIFGSGVPKYMPENTREIHSRMAAMCTFAIGITRHWAQSFLDHAYQGGTKGFDYSNHLQCGTSGMRCVSLRPELMHQQKSIGGGYHSEIEKATLAALMDGDSGAKQDGTAAETEKNEVHFFTFNVKHSARCNVGRADTDRTNCPPTDEEWKSYAA